MDKQNFRQGAIGVLLHVYEQAIADLIALMKNLADDKLPLIMAPLTYDENCRSLQTILTHVVNSGYGYATSINNVKGVAIVRPDKAFHLSVKAYQ